MVLKRHRKMHPIPPRAPVSVTWLDQAGDQTDQGLSFDDELKELRENYHGSSGRHRRHPPTKKSIALTMQ